MENLQTEIIDVAPPSADVSRLELAMGAGTLTLKPGSTDQLVHGTIRYNVPEWKPIIRQRDNMVRIEQDKSLAPSIRGKTINDWDLELGPAPVDLSLAAGAAKINLELGGLQLVGLRISQGASDCVLKLSAPNRAELDAFHFTAGAARSELRGLAFLNARRMEFDGGAGVLSLSFDGDLRQDVAVKVSASAGSVKIAVPPGVPSEAAVSGVMTNVKSDRTWSSSRGRYRTEGSGPSLTFDLKMSVGTLELKGA